MSPGYVKTPNPNPNSEPQLFYPCSHSYCQKRLLLNLTLTLTLTLHHRAGGATGLVAVLRTHEAHATIQTYGLRPSRVRVKVKVRVKVTVRLRFS